MYQSCEEPNSKEGIDENGMRFYKHHVEPSKKEETSLAPESRETDDQSFVVFVDPLGRTKQVNLCIQFEQYS